MKKIKSVNEFWGFSAKEKEEKQRKLDIEELKKELSKYNWVRMTAQPGGKKDTWTNEQLITLIKIRLNQAKTELPYLYKLVPQLFEFKGNGTKFNGISINKSQALPYLLKAAETNDTDAYRSLGQYYEYFNDNNEAIKWYEKCRGYEYEVKIRELKTQKRWFFF